VDLLALKENTVPVLGRRRLLRVGYGRLILATLSDLEGGADVDAIGEGAAEVGAEGGGELVKVDQHVDQEGVRQRLKPVADILSGYDVPTCGCVPAPATHTNTAADGHSD
jgi:hypothetical protein